MLVSLSLCRRRRGRSSGVYQRWVCRRIKHLLPCGGLVGGRTRDLVHGVLQQTLPFVGQWDRFARRRRHWMVRPRVLWFCCGFFFGCYSFTCFPWCFYRSKLEWTSLHHEFLGNFEDLVEVFITQQKSTLESFIMDAQKLMNGITLTLFEETAHADFLNSIL